MREQSSSSSRLPACLPACVIIETSDRLCSRYFCASVHLFCCLALVLDSEAAACDWWRQHSTAGATRPGFSPGAAAAQSCVHWADWPLHTVQQVSVWRVVGPSELELRLQTQTASLQHGQCRKLKLVDLISTPNIIRQHLSLTIPMNNFPDTNISFSPFSPPCCYVCCIPAKALHI